MYVSFDSAAPFEGFYSKEKYQKYKCINIQGYSLFITVKAWKIPKYPSMDQLNKSCYVPLWSTMQPWKKNVNYDQSLLSVDSIEANLPTAKTCL
jgi:hypothetical protein